MTKWSWRKEVENGQHPVTAVTLFAGALEYFQAARVLSASGGHCSVIVVSQLGCHAIECGLKAFLLLHGKSDADLRKISHDLEMAWAECNRLGFSLKPPEALGLGLLNSQYNLPHTYRYWRKGIGWSAPVWEDFQQATNDLLRAVQKEVGLDDYGKLL